MSSIINLITLFTSIFRIIGNAIKKARVKNIVHKLEHDDNYRQDKLKDISFTAGKINTTEYIKTYNALKSKAINVQTEKYEVKTVVEMDPNSFLIFVLCNDSEINIQSLGSNKLSKYIKFLFFKVQKHADKNMVDVRADIYNDLHEKHLMTGFFTELEKQIL